MIVYPLLNYGYTKLPICQRNEQNRRAVEHCQTNYSFGFIESRAMTLFSKRIVDCMNLEIIYTWS